MLRLGTPFSVWNSPSLSQPVGGASLKLLLRTDNFIGFQNMFLSMHHQNIAAEWSAFDQNRCSMLRTDTCFSAWTLPSLSQPVLGALLKLLLQTQCFIEFQNMFLSMNHQNLAVEWSAFNQKRHSMLRTGTPFSAWTRPSLPHLVQRESTTPRLSNWWFGGFQKSFTHVSNQQSTWHRMDTIQSKMTLSVVN
jgi:hypothetical protein